ncbi:MAG: methyltransferase domain-containing protein [Acidimicrobiia bacterium]
MNNSDTALHPDEVQRLDDIAATTQYGQGVNGVMVEYSVEIFRRWYRGGDVLEIGPADGVSSHLLNNFVDSLTLLEGSENYAAALRTALPTSTVEAMLIEEYNPSRQFDAIVLSHVLEHVEDAGAALARIKQWLRPGGFLFAATPNALSFHRQVGVIAGDLDDEHELNAADRSIGHRRVFDGSSLRALFTAAALEVHYFGGYFLKSLSNSQLAAVSDLPHLRALMRAGERVPENAADIYVIATLPDDARR